VPLPTFVFLFLRQRREYFLAQFTVRTIRRFHFPSYVLLLTLPLTPRYAAAVYAAGFLPVSFPLQMFLQLRSTGKR
jgi:hypothetical protein